jgi:glycosyltransferase involved in cell wall biosynthesis
VNSATHLVLIPTYDSGGLLRETVGAALACWQPVWVVVDGSTDRSDAGLDAHQGVRVIRRPRNGGKGAAVQTGLREAERAGFTHALVLDADMQHPAGEIAAFMRASMAQPEAMVLGQPRFGKDAPLARVWGRTVANALSSALTAGSAIGDCLFGFRVYPIGKLLACMEESGAMGGFEFDMEAVVRLAWRGVPAVKISVPVRYLRPDEGGVSHYRYGRDNLRLARSLLRLLAHLLRG